MPSTTRRRLWIAALAVVTGYALVAAIAFAVTIHKAERAQDLQKQLSTIQLGRTSSDEVDGLVLRFADIATRRSCADGGCVVEFRVDNRWMHRLLFAPITRFYASVASRDSRVTQVMCLIHVYTRLGSDVPRAIASTLETEFGPEHRSFWFGVGGRKASALVPPEASGSERQFAFEYNLGCLHKLSGCKDATEIVPVWWREEQKKPKLPPPE